jgi:hypothetical protein
MVNEMILVNMDLGSQYTAPVITVVGDGTGSVGDIYYGLSVWTTSVNASPTDIGQSTIGTIWYTGTDTYNDYTINFSPISNGSYYSLFKGTSEDTLRPYVNIGKGTGTYTDANPASIPTTGSTPVYNHAYDTAIILPVPSLYTPSYNRKLIVHDLDNLDRVIYSKGNVYAADLVFDNISKTEYTDLQTVFNWNAALRFYPRKNTRPDIYFDVFWQNSWNFLPTVKTWIDGNWSGNIKLEGLNKTSSISDVV